MVWWKHYIGSLIFLLQIEGILQFKDLNKCLIKGYLEKIDQKQVSMKRNNRMKYKEFLTLD